MRAPLSHLPRLAYLIIPNQPLAFVADANFSLVCKATYALRTGTSKTTPSSRVAFLPRARARARERRRVFSRLACPLIQEPCKPRRFEQRVRPPSSPRARSLRRRADIPLPPRLCPVDAAAPESFVSERTGFQVSAASLLTPVLESRPASSNNQPRRCGRVASRRFP